MKRIFTIFASVALGGTAFAASPLYFNAGVVTNTPQIDATNFVNWGTFSTFTSELPYSTKSTRNFTNMGVINGSIGFQLDTVDTASTPPRKPLTSFYNGNGGSITAEDSGVTAFFTGGATGGFGNLGASLLKISATNLVNHGALEVGTIGLMQLTGKSIDLSRGALAGGQASDSDTNFFNNGNFFGFFGNAYVNPFGVEDLYWGAGNVTLNLASGANFGFSPPDVRSPSVPVQSRSTAFGGVFLGQVSLPITTSSADFQAFANVNQFGTNVEVQVVFLKTNFTDTNISAEVRFGFSDIPVFPGQTVNPFGEAALVQFSVTNEFDPVTGQSITNSVYFVDGSAEETSIILITNALSINSFARPSGFEIDTTTPFGWDFAQPPNIDYDPTLIFPGNTYADKNVNAFFGAYGAKVGRNPETLSGTGFNTNFFGFGGFFDDTFLLFPDPTNQPSRIEINADKLDLTLARIRTEGLLSMNAKHLAGGGASDVSAGIINADLGSTNGSMVISNIFPSHFKRVRGDLFAWSAIWENTETNGFATNQVRFHVLILDHDLKADFKPTIRNLALRSTNLTVKDDLTIDRSATFQTENLTFEGNVTLSEQAIDLHAANLIGVRNFLNESNAVFQGANDAFFGFDTADGFDSIINRGVISAVAPLFKSAEFENSGSILATNGGSVWIQADNANLSNGSILADRNITISAADVIVTNSTITAGQPNLLGQLQFGQLVLDVPDMLTDLTPLDGTLNNFWQVTDGIVMQQKPSEGDLLGTEIRTIASGFQESQNIWPGDDVGAVRDGYINNVAVGHLILDLRSSASRLRFTGAGFQNAMYVVNLDFQAGPDVDINTSLTNLLSIDENMTIYFINSNAGDKLTTAFPPSLDHPGGCIIRVDSFDSLSGASPLIVNARGLGIISPNLDGKNLTLGSDYKMKATAAAGNVFAGWSGGTNSPNASLTFKMTRNLVLQANFVPNPFDAVKGTYNGLFYDAVNGVRNESSGFINLNLTRKGVVTGKLISGKAYPFSGKLNSSGHAEITVLRPKQTSLNLSLQADIGTQTEQVHGNVSGETWTATFVGDRIGSSAGLAGKYTFVIPGNNSSGDGFGTATVSASGGIRFKGALSDGTPIQQQAGLSKNGRWPFYVPLYNGEGSVLSWVNFTNEIDGGVGGDLSWFKKGSSATATNTTVITGSHYSPPAKGSPTLEITNGIITLKGGNLSHPITNNVEMASGASLSVDGTNQLSLSIRLPDGLLSGHFVHPDTKALTPIKGVVLQQQNSARGFFSGTNHSGSLLLENK